MGERERVVPGDGHADESPPVEDGLDEDAGVFVLHRWWRQPGVGVAGVVVPGRVDELVGTRRRSFRGVRGVVAFGFAGPDCGEDELDGHVRCAVWVGCVGRSSGRSVAGHRFSGNGVGRCRVGDGGVGDRDAVRIAGVGTSDGRFEEDDHHAAVPARSSSGSMVLMVRLSTSRFMRNPSR